MVSSVLEKRSWLQGVNLFKGGTLCDTVHNEESFTPPDPLRTECRVLYPYNRKHTGESVTHTHTPYGRHAPWTKRLWSMAPISTYLTGRVKYVEYTGDAVCHRLPLVGRLDRGIFRLLGKECERGGCGQQRRPLPP